jgi:hypothetical protein
VSAPKHTPGPWLAKRRGEDVQISDADGYRRIVTVCADEITESGGERLTGEQEANARLIAKAPELLELVRGVVGLERRKLLKDKGARAWVGACEALLAELGELDPRQEVES